MIITSNVVPYGIPEDPPNINKSVLYSECLDGRFRLESTSGLEPWRIVLNKDHAAIYLSSKELVELKEFFDQLHVTLTTRMELDSREHEDNEPE